MLVFVADDLDKRKKLTKSLLASCAVVEFPAVKDAEAKSWARTRLKELKTTADDRVLSEVVRLVAQTCKLCRLSWKNLRRRRLRRDRSPPRWSIS